MFKVIALLFFFAVVSCNSKSASDQQIEDQQKLVQQKLNELDRMIEEKKNQQEQTAQTEPDNLGSEQIQPDIPDGATNAGQFVGLRNVLLRTTETDCIGRSQGDVRPETWSFSISANQLQLKVKSDERTINEYNDYSFADGLLIMKGKRENLLGVAGQATIKLTLKNGKIEGTRKVSTTDDKGNPCTIDQVVVEQ